MGPRRLKQSRPQTGDLPLDPLIPALLDLLERQAEADSAACDSVARALLALCVVNEQARGLGVGSGPLLSYEAARLGYSGPFFRDGLAIDPFGPKAGNEVGFASRHINATPVQQFQLDRVETARLLHGAKDEDVLRFVRKHDAPDFPNAPLRVRVFVGRVRHVAQTLTAGGRAPCRVCARQFLAQDGDSSDDESSPEGEYWRCAGGFPVPRSHMPVCCSPCADAMKTEMEAASGITAAELLDYDSPPDASGSRRVHIALRAAFRRNELVSRRLRSPPELKHLSPAEALEMRKFSSTMLNVDLALLLVCEKAVGLNAYRNRMLVPMVLKWRQNRAVFLAPLMRVASMYDRLTSSAPPRAPVYTVLCKPRWLDKIVDAFQAILVGR